MKYLIIGYKKFISPMSLPRCKYYPSCSSYALLALERYGFVYGLYLSTKRIFKCNPFSNGGVDEVPEKVVK